MTHGDEDLPLPPRLRHVVDRWREAPPENAAAKAALHARIAALPRPMAPAARPYAWRYSVAAVAVAALLLVAIVLPRRAPDAPDTVPGGRSATPGTTHDTTLRTTPVVLSVSDARAGHVSVAGDFNGWDTTGVALTRRGDRWSVSLALPAGRYAYAFRVDNRWIVDESAPRAPSDFGGPVSILVVSNQRHR